MASSTMILSMIEHMGVELSLGVLGLVAELVLKLSSGHWLRPEGTHATGWAEFLDVWVLLVPVTPGVGAHISRPKVCISHFP